MMRILGLVVAVAIAQPAFAQDISRVPLIGSSPNEGRALLESSCDKFVLAEEQYLTCTWGTGEALTGSYTKTGKLYYVQWLFPSGARPDLEPIVKGLGFPLTQEPCDFYGDTVDCWRKPDGTGLRFEITGTTDQYAFYIWNAAIDAEDGD
jgi:hypothetical protein